MLPCSLRPLAALITADILHPSQVDSTNARCSKKKINKKDVGCFFCLWVRVSCWDKSWWLLFLWGIMSTLADNAGYRSLKAFVQPYQTLGRCGKTQQESAQWKKAVMAVQKPEAPGILDSPNQFVCPLDPTKQSHTSSFLLEQAWWLLLTVCPATILTGCNWSVAPGFSLMRDWIWHLGNKKG